MWSPSNYVGLNKDSSSEITFQSIGQYIEDYIDLVENVPNEIVREITKLHELNHRYHQFLEKIESLSPEGQDNGARTERSIAQLHKYLIAIQAISDEKLFLAQSICEQLEYKARQLDLDYRNVTSGSNFNNIISPIKSATSSREAFPVLYSRDSSHANANANFGSSLQATATPEPTATRYNAAESAVTSTSSIVPLVATEPNDTEDADDNEMETSFIPPPVQSHGGQTSKASNGNHAMPSSPSKRGGKRGGYHGRGGGTSGAYQSEKAETINSSKKNNQDQAADQPSHGSAPASGGGGKGRGGGSKRGMKNRGGETSHGTGKRGRGAARDPGSPPPSLYEENPIDPDEPTYCLCDQISFGEMICCDNTACQLEWFHFQCVALSTKPKGKWYCPQCRGDRSNVPRK